MEGYGRTRIVLACISGRMTGYDRTRNIIASSMDLMIEGYGRTRSILVCSRNLKSLAGWQVMAGPEI